jgi:drug/metabolite transporter (DMT)-like permease
LGFESRLLALDCSSLSAVCRCCTSFELSFATYRDLKLKTQNAKLPTRMTWWSCAILSAACWGMQYLLLETLFGRVEFAAAFSFLSLANGLMVAAIMFVISPKQNWTQLWQNWPVAGLVFLYLVFGTGAYVFNAYAIHQKNATMASLLEIAYPVFIILFTAVFLRKVHLNLIGFAGAFLIIGGSVLVVLSRSK